MSRNTRLSSIFFAAVVPSLFAMSGCSVDSSAQPEITKQLASQKGGIVDGEDVCVAKGWYGDKECDTFCVDADTDCAPNAEEPVYCAEFIEDPDKVCSRADDDPCRLQDPDCGGGGDPYVGDDGGDSDDVMCAEYIEVADGECKRKDSDPCRFQDADCIAVNCTTLSEASDGVCSRAVTDGCRFQDPDCEDGVVCAAYIEESDGVCGRSIRDECRSQDPDCEVSVGCAKFIEESDGTCSRPETDKCRSQDPDC